MPDFSRRSEAPELMDDLRVSGPYLNQALFELEAINYVLGGNYVTLNGFAQLVKRNEPRELHIADLGCGSGDMLKRLRVLLARRKVNAVLTGFDANHHVIQYAEAHTPSSCRIQYEPMNILSDEFRSRKFDIVTATLFFHHFNTQQLIGFFKQLRGQVAVGIVINDIHRHWFSYYAIKWLTKLFSRSVMVKHDAPLSVLRAFTRRELKHILMQAGISRFKIRWCWAFRWQVVAWL